MSGFGFYFVAIIGFVLALQTAATVPGCGGTLTGTQGSFTSPNYPLSYHHGKTCEWNIRVPTGFHVELKIDDFHLEAHSSCNYDVFEVYGGEDDSAPLLARMCGNQTTSRTLTTTGNTMMVRFRTDGSVAHTGFSVSYKAVTEGCGGTLTGTQGSFTSPNYPLSYHHGKTCVWNIRVPTGFHVELKIDDFHLETHSSCNYDVFEVYGGEDDSAPLLARLCGNQSTSRTLTTTGNTMMVRFRTDGSVAYTGFSVSYKAITEGCGGTLTGTQGSFTSPNYPLSYHHGKTCVWNIRVPTGFHVELKIDDFHLETHSSCSFDVFEVYGGEDDSAPLLARMCGNQTTSRTLTTTGNTMMVRFRTDGSVAHTGFSVSYKAVTEG
ncbi:deleted in malignant brain tumors 1 protein-like [Haliotis rubra]|uniref:deleted in malignant brain tumors 1 protein-like n=1 Tax=Haliotis rubra TaxID=36100 RepID=UPI001EE61EF6|nr:deleted in malignant brain tumors 1 protein-like [Haliotis rubra]XP_046580046.1 deleted in malignant brain tumors 1 protein-like [Haliotis rubra]XP_046580047.1 deleted in malignant brain tumors 1 protein-like [Haliotis rubra]XP_046580048.1 deleted in malignant brain tumors 1 protein-like [Haliotis rubra]XP_046580049.1 deleted in malignant brain tumors 1 protein-like [Haliotis rubra]XP_046580050.1 deleted in malignant brain tumors 1 protein-like [Haliotis rubra]XP_046580051.1 deleted in mal